MRRLIRFFVLAAAFALALPLLSFAQQTDNAALAEQFKARVEQLGVTDITFLESEWASVKFEGYVEQPIDHKHPSKGTFKQRIFVMHVGFDRPSVIVTEGYNADYAARPRYRDELSEMFNTNIVFVEHRYFANSTPEPLDWKYMNGEQEAADLHNIMTIFKQVYPGKWIATGISKGGQNAMIYTSYYPEDMDISVPYVGPLCRAAEDGRHEPFLAEYVGTQAQRDSIQAFQMRVLDNREAIMPLFDSLCKADGLTFRIPKDEAFDFCVLEFPFAFWQWGNKTSTLPGEDATPAQLFKYLCAASGPDYFAEGGPHGPFFVQAAKELGYYGYDITPFKDKMVLKSPKGYLQRIFLPKDVKVRFSKKLYRHVHKFVTTNTTSKMVFIYGQFDPWSAVRVPDPSPKQTNMHVFIDPAGSHRSRIRTLPAQMQKEAVEIIQQCLDEQVEEQMWYPAVPAPAN